MYSAVINAHSLALLHECGDFMLTLKLKLKVGLRAVLTGRARELCWLYFKQKDAVICSRYLDIDPAVAQTVSILVSGMWRLVNVNFHHHRHHLHPAGVRLIDDINGPKPARTARFLSRFSFCGAVFIRSC